MKVLKKLPLLAWIIIAIASGVLIGMLTPGMISGINDATGAAIPTDLIVQIFVSFSTVFSAFLSFAIPLIIIGFIVPGIGSLAQGAGKMLGITVGLAYISSILAGFLALACALLLYPIILQGQQLASFDNPENALSKGYISIELTPIMGVLSALILSFILGLGITALKTRAMLNLFEDFQVIVEKMLGYVIIPLLPVHIVGVFANMTLKTMLPAYFTAIGTQSSAATIPVTVRSAKKAGISPRVVDFAIPLCATIHLSGSMITITSCSVAVLFMTGQHPDFGSLIPMILVLGVMMVAAPGVPGGGVMTAIGLLQSMLGFDTSMIALMIALYLAQDSFGTATNVTGDATIAALTERISKASGVNPDKEIRDEDIEKAEAISA